MGDLAGGIGSSIGNLFGHITSIFTGAVNDFLTTVQNLVPADYRLPVVLVIIAAILALLLVRR